MPAVNAPVRTRACALGRGNLWVCLPEETRARLGWVDGTVVTLTLDNGGLIVRPATEKKGSEHDNEF